MDSLSPYYGQKIVLPHWKDKFKTTITQWIENLITPATYEQVAHKYRLRIDKYNEI